jgi:hypothetical protein
MVALLECRLMAKALKIAGAVVAVAGLAIITGGLAAGASLSFIMSAGFGVGSLTVGGLIAVSAALNTAGSLLSPKPKAPSTSEANANRLTVSMDVRAFRKTVVGSTAMATDLRDQEWSADQSILHRFVVCASHRCQAIREIWFDDKLAWTATGGVQGPYIGYLDVTPVLEGSAANAINIGPRMGNTRRYTGLAYVYLRYKLTGNGKKAESPFASSIPSRVTIVGDGALFYDPRLDSTVPGGSGPMRADDQRTWAWSNSACRNPALGLLFFLLGWRIQNPVTGEWKLAVGKGIPASRIDLQSFITAANLCDEPVTRADGTIEPRYRADGIYSEGDDPGLVLDNYKAAMNAVLDDADGKIRVTVLHNDLAAPIGDLTTADVLGEFTWLQTPPLTDSINIVRGGYTDPSANSLYQLVDLPEVRIPSPDGIDRPQTVNLALVQSAGQGQRLFKLRLGRAQYGGTFTAIFQATAWKYQKGDVIRLSFLPLGWDRKLFRIADTATQVDGTVPMMLREEHPDIYAAYSNEAAAITAAAPTSYDPSLWPVVQGIADAGTTANWSSVADDDGTRPEDNATVGAPPGTMVGDKPVEIVIQQIEQIEPIKTAVSAIALVQVDHADELAILDTARIDIEASQRQLNRDAGKLSEATLRLLAEAGHTRRVMRDAGITVDADSGIVRFHALDQIANRTTKAEIELNAQKGQISQKASTDYVDEQIIKAALDPKQVAELEPILKRVANAEILVDGFAGLITSKADVTEVTRIGGRVKTAEENIDAANTAITNRVEKTTFEGLEKTVQAIEQKLLIDGDTVGLTVTIRQARSVAADAAQGALQGLLAADAADRRQFDQVTQARQELTTRMDDGLRTEASNRLALSVEVASLRAYAVSETTALVKAGEVTARSIEALGASSKQYAAAIGDLNTASITADGSIVSMRTTIRQVANQAETSDEAMLRALIAGDEASRARQAQLVQVQTETNTQLVANERASAVARETLLVRMGLAEAAIVETRRVLATNNQALVERVSATEAVLSDKETGLAATLARLVTEEEANVERGKATAKAIETLDVALNDPKTGLAITVAAIGKAQETLIEDGKTTAKSIETINTSLNDPKTGLSVTVAAIGKAQETLVEDGKTTAKSIETINTTLNDPKTGLAVSVAAIGKSQETLVEDGKATAKSIESLTTKLGDLGEATVQDLIEAIVADTGLIKATRTLAIDINGNLVGTQLVGAKEGAGTLALINADLSMGTGRVIFDTGTVMKVQGLGFGVNKDLVTWFGPTMPIDKCSRSNGRVWEGTDGKGYWGAGLSVGVLHVARQTPDLAADASIVIGPFNTKGGSKVLVVSYAYELTRASSNKGSVTGKPTATIHLDRLDGESWALVQSFDVTGTTEYEAPSIDGDGYGRQTMGGAITFTDTKAGLGDFTYRARITARALASFNFNSPDSGREVQSLSLSSTEE